MPVGEDAVDVSVTLASTPDQLAVAGRLLHDFNTEFDDPSPGPEVLASRLRVLLDDGSTEVLLAGGAARDAVAGGSGGAGGAGGAPADVVVDPAGVAVLRFRRSLWSEADECYLAELYVVPGRRGSGLGRALLRECLERARERGCDSVDLATSEDDVAARHLYESEGFRRTEGAGGPLTFHYEIELPAEGTSS